MNLKIAFASIYNPRDINQWSGTPYHMLQAFSQQDTSIECIASLKNHLPLNFKFEQLLKRITRRQVTSQRFNIFAMKNYAMQVAAQLKIINSDVVLAAHVNPIAYLDCKQPIILWTDALFANLVGFHPPSSTISAISINEANEVTRESLQRCRLAIFSSEWAARGATELYGISENKVKVVPFGANLTCNHQLNDIHQMINARSQHTVRLLFIGKMWEQKGGDIVMRVAKKLHAANYSVELNIVGCTPSLKNNEKFPDYIKCHGFISKHTPEGNAIISQLLRDTHFLFVPSRAECFGIVFAEASAYGVPSLTSCVGGIPSAVRNQINGINFALDATIEEYCQVITDLIGNKSQYEALALSSFNEYETRLNWKTATQSTLQLIKEAM